MARYRKKPIEVEAYKTDKEMIIHTLEGDMQANVGDYIITGVKGEQYPCKPEIFEATYEISSADVVPKSEVEALRHDIERIIDEGEYWQGKYLVAKQEVAREIFEDMQSCLIQRHWNGLDIVSFEFDAVKYAELKKKYTEGEKEK